MNIVLKIHIHFFISSWSCFCLGLDLKLFHLYETVETIIASAGFYPLFMLGNRWGGGGLNAPDPASSASIRSPSSKAASPWLPCRSRSARTQLSSDSLRCIINTLAGLGAMIHFLERRCQLSKSIKKEPKPEMLGTCRPPLIYDCFVL